jgi:hypothetical protein
VKGKRNKPKGESNSAGGAKFDASGLDSDPIAEIVPDYISRESLSSIRETQVGPAERVSELPCPVQKLVFRSPFGAGRWRRWRRMKREAIHGQSAMSVSESPRPLNEIAA